MRFPKTHSRHTFKKEQYLHYGAFLPFASVSLVSKQIVLYCSLSISYSYSLLCFIALTTVGVCFAVCLSAHLSICLYLCQSVRLSTSLPPKIRVNVRPKPRYFGDIIFGLCFLSLLSILDT